MKKYIATMLVVIVLLAALLFFMRIHTNSTPMLLIPGGSSLQLQPAGQFELETEPAHELLPPPHDEPSRILPDVQPDFDWKHYNWERHSG